ncbi:hypothetical protein [Pseudomonas sp. BIC9C]
MNLPQTLMLFSFRTCNSSKKWTGIKIQQLPEAQAKKASAELAPPKKV